MVGEGVAIIYRLRVVTLKESMVEKYLSTAVVGKVAVAECTSQVQNSFYIQAGRQKGKKKKVKKSYSG